jgi:hypothetical protein
MRIMRTPSPSVLARSELPYCTNVQSVLRGVSGYQIDEEEMKRQFLGKLPAEMTGAKSSPPLLDLVARLEKIVADLQPATLESVQADLQSTIQSLKSEKMAE